MSACVAAPPTLDPVEYCVRQQQAQCRAKWACCTTPALLEFATPLAECETGPPTQPWATVCAQLFQGVYDGVHLTWDGAAAARDIARLESANNVCAEPVGLEGPVTFALGEGDQCSGAGLPGIALFGCGFAGLRCDATALGGTCRPLVGEGGFCSDPLACEIELECDVDSSTCVRRSPLAPASLGETCDPDRDGCGLGLYCDARDATCHTLLTEGGVCSLGGFVGECAPGLYCDEGTTDRCVRRLAPGSGCELLGPPCDGVPCTAGVCRERTPVETLFCN